MVKRRMKDIKLSGTSFLVSVYVGLIPSFYLLLPPAECLGKFLLLPSTQLSQAQALPPPPPHFSCIIHNTYVSVIAFVVKCWSSVFQ